METTAVPQRMLLQGPVEPMESVESPMVAPSESMESVETAAVPQRVPPVASVASVAPEASAAPVPPAWPYAQEGGRWQDMPVNTLILQENKWQVMRRLLDDANRLLGSPHVVHVDAEGRTTQMCTCAYMHLQGWSRVKLAPRTCVFLHGGGRD